MFRSMLRRRLSMLKRMKVIQTTQLVPSEALRRMRHKALNYNHRSCTYHIASFKYQSFTLSFDKPPLTDLSATRIAIIDAHWGLGPLGGGCRGSVMRSGNLKYLYLKSKKLLLLSWQLDLLARCCRTHVGPHTVSCGDFKRELCIFKLSKQCKCP